MVDFEIKLILCAETCQKQRFLLVVLVNDKNDKYEIAQGKMSVNTTSDIFQEYANVFDERYHIEIDPFKFQSEFEEEMLKINP